METDSLKWVGSSCGLHGPYIFYKAFKFHRDGKARILSLGDFFLVRCTPEDPICIAELQLLWEERTTKQLLSSSKLYFLPEDTPAGRTVNHGEDEVVGVSEKVVLRLEDLVKWTVVGLSGWARGRRAGRAVPGGAAVPKMAVLRELGTNGHRDPHLGGNRSTPTHLGTRLSISFRDVQREKAQIGEDEEERMKVRVLSYPQYCRYRCVLARLRGGSEVAVVTERIVRALGGIVPLHGDERILYCRETFQHPTLVHNESVCEHFAPNLKGRPRKRKLSQRPDSQNQNRNPNPSLQTGPQPRNTARTGSEPPEPRPPPKVRTECRVVVAKVKTGVMCRRVSTEEKREERMERPKEVEDECVTGREGEQTDEEAFLKALDQYMWKRETPIERIPFLGFKQINLWMMFQSVQRLGGYEQITARKQWKLVYDELGGDPGSTSAATCTRRHYERLLLPYERHSKGQGEGQCIEPHPIQAEPVSIPGSEDKSPSPSSRRSRAGGAPVDQNPQLPDDGGVSQHSLHLKDVSRNRKIKRREKEEEELQLAGQKETPVTATPDSSHHDNQQSAHPTHMDISLQTNQAPSPSSLPDLPGGLSHQSEELSRGGVSKGEMLEPQAHRQATSPGHHPLQSLGVLEPHMVGRIPEKDLQPLGPVKEEAAEGCTPGSLNSARGSERSSPNSQTGPSFSPRVSDRSSPNSQNVPFFSPRGSERSSPNSQTGPYFSPKVSDRSSPNSQSALFFSPKGSDRSSPNSQTGPSFSPRVSDRSSPNSQSAPFFSPKGSDRSSPNSQTGPSFSPRVSDRSSPNSQSAPFLSPRVSDRSSPNSKNAPFLSPRVSDRSSPNSKNAPFFSPRVSDRSSPNSQTGPYFNSLHSVMSPLAKKKLLSQVCAGGGGVPQNYLTVPLVAARSDAGTHGSSRAGGGGGEDVAVARALDPVGQEGAPIDHPASPETAPAPRPSVIQHAQSFRAPWGTDDERPSPAESCLKQEPPLRGQLLPQPHSKLSFSPDPAARGMESQGSVQRPWGESPAQPLAQASHPHASGCRGQVFYSSPHLQSLYRHAKHRLSQQHRQQHLGSQVQGFLTRQGPPRGEMAGVAQNVPDVLIDERYSTPPPPPHFGCHSSKAPFAKGPFGSQIYPTMHRDCRAPAPIQRGLDTRGTACTRFPVAIKDASVSYEVVVHGRVSGTGGVRPSGGLTRNPGAVIAAKRPMEDEESRVPPAKTSPPPLPSTREEPTGSGAFSTREEPTGSGAFSTREEPTGSGAFSTREEPTGSGAFSTREEPTGSGAFSTREEPTGSGAFSTRVSERQGEEAEPPEPARAVHLNSYSSQGLRYAPHARHLGGLCPVGTFGAREACEGPRAVGYPPPHPLAFLKSHRGAAPDGMAPPQFVLPALMMQGQLMISPTPTSLCQASSARGMGMSRSSEPVPHSLDPLRPFNPPHTYPTLQLPALKPNTKL